MADSVYLINPTINGGAAVKVECQRVLVGWKNNVDTKPTPGRLGDSYEAAEAQKQSIENPTYTVQPLFITGNSGTLTQPLLMEFAKNAYDGTSSTRTELRVEYNNGTMLYASDGASTSIPVEVESFNLPVDVRDSHRASIITGGMILRETK